MLQPQKPNHSSKVCSLKDRGDVLSYPCASCWSTFGSLQQTDVITVSQQDELHLLGASFFSVLVTMQLPGFNLQRARLQTYGQNYSNIQEVLKCLTQGHNLSSNVTFQAVSAPKHFFSKLVFKMLKTLLKDQNRHTKNKGSIQMKSSAKLKHK